MLALAAPIGLLLVARRERLCLARQVGLLAGAEGLLASHGRLLGALLIHVVHGVVALVLLRSIVRIGLAELLLGKRDQAVIMLSMLKIVLRRDRIARGLGVARQLHVLVGDV